MPKTKRDTIKRRLAQAYINVEWAGRYITDLHTIFAAQHPELAAQLQLIIQGIILILDSLSRFASEAYNTDQPDWTGWAATGRPANHPLDDVYPTATILLAVEYALAGLEQQGVQLQYTDPSRTYKRAPTDMLHNAIVEYLQSYT